MGSKRRDFVRLGEAPGLLSGKNILGVTVKLSLSEFHAILELGFDETSALAGCLVLPP